MKNKLILAALLIATAAIIPACKAPTTPEELARRQRYEAIGEKLLTMGANRGIITKDEAAEIKDMGGIILATQASPVQPIAAPLTATK